MLSQKTVGKLQRFLELMFSQVIYGTAPALNVAEYYRRLYEAGVRPDLLDRIGNECEFHPSFFVRSLHEGRPVSWVNRTLDRNYSVSAQTEAEVGDAHLLVFAAVALSRYEELGDPHRSQILEAGRDFLGSLKSDGFTYSKGQMFDQNGQAITAIPLDGGKTQAPSQPQAENMSGSESVSSPAGSPHGASDTAEISNAHLGWSRADTIAAWGLLFAALIAAAAWLVVPEFRNRFHLDKHAPTTEDNSHQERFYVSGTVVDAENRAVPQALVSVSGRAESYVTEDNGNFRLEFTAKRADIERLRIRATKPGYRVYDASVTPPVSDLIIQLQKR